MCSADKTVSDSVHALLGWQEFKQKIPYYKQVTTTKLNVLSEKYSERLALQHLVYNITYLLKLLKYLQWK